ncbi:MAG: molybdenum ABC transporter ATP-binding protein [Pirellulales bacterium]
MSRLEFRCQHYFAGGFDLDVQFDADDGVTAVFGPSGSGKSTTLSITAGLLRPRHGFVKLSDRVLLDTEAGRCVPPNQRHIGFVFQDHLLFPHMSVRRNLLYGKRRRPGRNIQFDRVVEILELEHLLDRYPATLSGGQRQRTALGRAILSSPELLVMDEPLTALDEGLKDRILAYLEKVVSEYHLPTLFVSHDQTDVRRLADRVVVIEGGRVVASGPTSATLDRAVISTMRSHPGPTNLLLIEDVKRTHEHWEGRIGQQRFRLPADTPPNGSVHHIQLSPRDVTLCQHAVEGLSARNQLRGRVDKIVALEHRTFVAVDVGQLIWAEVSDEVVDELKLCEGAEVYCLIKAAAAQPLY